MTLAMQFLLVLHSAREHGFAMLCLPACKILTLKHVSSSSAETHSSSAAACKESSGQQKDSEQSSFTWHQEKQQAHSVQYIIFMLLRLGFCCKKGLSSTKHWSCLAKYPKMTSQTCGLFIKTARQWLIRSRGKSHISKMQNPSQHLSGH